MNKKSVVSFPGLLLKKGKIKEQFYLTIKELILNGQLKAGSKLPSSRTFSEMMSISRNSVIASVDRLIDEGYLMTKHGSGTFVTSTVPDDVIHIKAIATGQDTSPENSVPNIHPALGALTKIWQKTAPLSGNNMTFNMVSVVSIYFPMSFGGAC